MYMHKGDQRATNPPIEHCNKFSQFNKFKSNAVCFTLRRTMYYVAWGFFGRVIKVNYDGSNKEVIATQNVQHPIEITIDLESE